MKNKKSKGQWITFEHVNDVIHLVLNNEEFQSIVADLHIDNQTILTKLKDSKGFNCYQSGDMTILVDLQSPQTYSLLMLTLAVYTQYYIIAKEGLCILL